MHVFKDEIRRLGTVANDFSSPLPISYVNVKDLPPSFDWGNVGGRSFLTHSLNQHLPHYCGSCFAHGSLSALADRIKIVRGPLSPDINLSIQFVLNCGSDIAGSCHGGSGSGVYEFVKKNGFVPFDTCMPYVACSADLENGICEHMDFSCSSINTCRTCTHLGCGEVDIFPNATVAEYGTIKFNIDAIKAEIFVRGPVAASINGKELHTYTGGIFNDTNASNRTEQRTLFPLLDGGLTRKAEWNFGGAVILGVNFMARWDSFVLDRLEGMSSALRARSCGLRRGSGPNTMCLVGKMEAIVKRTIQIRDTTPIHQKTLWQNFLREGNFRRVEYTRSNLHELSL